MVWPPDTSPKPRCSSQTLCSDCLGREPWLWSEGHRVGASATSGQRPALLECRAIAGLPIVRGGGSYRGDSYRCSLPIFKDYVLDRTGNSDHDGSEREAHGADRCGLRRNPARSHEAKASTDDHASGVVSNPPRYHRDPLKINIYR